MCFGLTSLHILGSPSMFEQTKGGWFLAFDIKMWKKIGQHFNFLSQAGKLQLTNAVFSALPTFYMCTFKLHKTVIKQIDKFRKHCLWTGADLNARTPPKAVWHIVCLPKSQGGLGVINLTTQNEALLLKNLHKFFNRLNISWVHLMEDLFTLVGLVGKPSLCTSLS